MISCLHGFLLQAAGFVCTDVHTRHARMSSRLRNAAAPSAEELLVSSQVAVAEQKADAELDLLMRDLSGYDKPPSKADLLKVPLI
jgi:hypothetical protein